MMSRKGIKSEILEILTELENNPNMPERLERFLCGKLTAFCEVLDGDLFARINSSGETFLDEDYRWRLEKFIDLD